MVYREKQAIYLYPDGDCRYGAVISPGKPPLVGITQLTEVGSYPVNVLYSHIDCTKKLCYEREICETPSALLSLLQWCGNNRHVIHQIWQFDLDTTQNKALYTLFQNVQRKRIAIIEQGVTKG